MKYALAVLLALLPFAWSTHPVQAANPHFYFEDNTLDLDLGDTRTVQLRLDTHSQETTGADVLMTYDPDRIEIDRVIFSTPVLYQQNFFINNFVSNPDIATLKLTSTMTNPASSFSGQKIYAYITITAKQTGSASLDFVCNNGSTSDTNLTQKSSVSDIVQCGDLEDLEIQVSSNVSDDEEDEDDDVGGPTNADGNTSCKVPASPTGITATTIDQDTILLRWTHSPDAKNYSLLYGPTDNAYQYGAADFGYTNQLLVNFLKPGTTYEFALMAVNDCSSSSMAKFNGRTALYASNNSGGNSYTRIVVASPTPYPTAYPQASTFPTPIPSATTAGVGNQTTCQTNGGSWRQYANTCGDTCALITSPQTAVCGQALTYSCDCGLGSCWNGVRCIANPTVVASPSPTATNSGTASPSATPTSFTEDELSEIPSLDTPVEEDDNTFVPITDEEPAEETSPGSQFTAIFLVAGILMLLAAAGYFVIQKMRPKSYS